MITTADAERKVVTPEGLQAEIDKLAATFTDGRSFVRWETLSCIERLKECRTRKYVK